ncbi:MAG: FliA/WhiG family RNA polymerase sigma factor [Lachnospiraceae bacterium]|nr:FliA/WhiG family RNA polymerase sigma factor [Lachnospiraceae bacterium]MDE6233367.1 FliA/WhiG family RNA polymerase sigma factor [Lachnospiraceae bacterium]MDE6253688.1 FliA/WhiG family RNA polymerase sigma factor [Lachnospiraceae bacterium]
MTESERNKLWDEYSKNKSMEIRDKIILEYASLVKIVAGRLSMYLGYNVEYEDLVGYGIFGLIDAIDKFDIDKGNKFETYASLRIRGAILDQIRKMDWIPRSLRQKQRKIDTAISELELSKGRTPTDKEVADSLGISEEEYCTWQGQTKVSNLMSLDEFVETTGEKNVEPVKSSGREQPETVAERNELKKILAETLDVLTEKERKVILLYYYEELTLKEISSILEVSESRISQLHTKALQKMKKKLGKHIEELALI